MYKPECWWWEVFETFRRLSLTGALMVANDPLLQPFLGVTICLAALMMYSHHNPFITTEDNRIAGAFFLNILVYSDVEIIWLFLFQATPRKPPLSATPHYHRVLLVPRAYHPPPSPPSTFRHLSSSPHHSPLPTIPCA